jgi:hypothetical protein
MTDRYDALERLQRLRESGALTDEEFQAEKRRLLEHDVAPVRERVTEVDTESAKRSRLWLWVLLGVGGVAIALAIGLLVGRSAGGGPDEGIVNLPAPAEAPAETNLLQAQPAALQDVRSLTEPEQRSRAFEAAFNAHGQAVTQVNGRTYTYTPIKLSWIGDRAVLISGGTTDNCHLCDGVLAVHYLRAAGDKFQVTGSWLDAVSGGSWGKPPKWHVTNAFTSFPAIYEEGGYTGQGCTSSMATITELAPARPVRSASIRLLYDNGGTLGADAAAPARVEGRIANVKKDVSFDVVYTGAQQLTETWVKRGDHFELAGGGETKIPQC